MNLPLFLTAYDPTELPGGSIDPLGFGQGYTALAEALFPGLTGAASEPDYLPVLCAAILWADEAGANVQPRAQRRQTRREVAMRMERAWGLAKVSYWRAQAAERKQEFADEELEGFRLLGITYFQDEYERVERKRSRIAGTRFKVLSRQSAYGMLGIYPNVASRLGLIDVDDYELTSALGLPLAEAFVEHTLRRSDRQDIRRMVQHASATVSIETLLRWGKRCHDPTGWPTTAAQSLKSGLLRDPDRTATLRVLQLVREHMGPGQTELDLLTVALSLTRKTVSLPIDERERQRLEQLFAGSVALEEAYRWVMVVFERVLWLARDTDRQKRLRSTQEDEVLSGCHDELKSAADRLRGATEALQAGGQHHVARGVDDVVRFVGSAGLSTTPDALVDLILERHRQIQHGKYDRGRRKLPWVERRRGMLTIASSTAGGQRGVITKPEQIPLHAWRVYPALNYLRAVGGVL